MGKKRRTRDRDHCHSNLTPMFQNQIISANLFKVKWNSTSTTLFERRRKKKQFRTTKKRNELKRKANQDGMQ